MPEATARRGRPPAKHEGATIELRGKVALRLLEACRREFPGAASHLQAVRALLRRCYGEEAA